MKKNNRGFTLIELLVSMAILGMVSLAASGFMAVAARVYNSVNYSIKLQYESQLVMTQLQEYIIDCNKGIAWDSDTSTLYLVNEDDGNDTMYVFRFDKTNESIYFGTGNVTDAGATATDLMAEHITDMKVDLKQLDDDNHVYEVELTLSLERSEKYYTGTQVTALRNKPIGADSWADLRAELIK